MNRVLPILILTGCATVGHREVPGPNGETILEAYCNGASNTLGDCMIEAAKSCPGGKYEAISREAQSSAVGGGAATGAFVTPVMTRQLFYRCVGK